MATSVNFCPPLHHKAEGPTDAAKVALPSPFVVTIAGGSRGIGLGIAKAYAQAGASGIIICGRSTVTLSAAAEEISAVSARTKVVTKQVDVTNEQSVQELVGTIEADFERLDVLVINAALSTPTILRPETGLRDWPYGLTEGKISVVRDILELNVTASYLLMQSFIPLLAHSKNGPRTIVQISSSAAHYVTGDLQAGGYGLSKFAATRLVELAHEAHHERDGISAFAVQPGGVKTDFASDLPQGKGWEERLIDDVGLCGGVCVWLTREKRDWLSGRYVDSRWDFEALESKREQIVREDLLKLRLAM